MFPERKLTWGVHVMLFSCCSMIKEQKLSKPRESCLGGAGWAAGRPNGGAHVSHESLRPGRYVLIPPYMTQAVQENIVTRGEVFLTLIYAPIIALTFDIVERLAFASRSQRKPIQIRVGCHLQHSVVP